MASLARVHGASISVGALMTAMAIGGCLLPSERYVRSCPNTAVITERTLLLVLLPCIQEYYSWQSTRDALFSLCSQWNQRCYDNLHQLRTLFQISECNPSGYATLSSPALCFPACIITAELTLSPRQPCKEQKWWQKALEREQEWAQPTGRGGKGMFHPGQPQRLSCAGWRMLMKWTWRGQH